MSETKKKGVFSRVPGTSWIILILLWLCYAFNGGCREILNKVLPAMVQDLGMSPTVSGMLSTIGTVGGGALAAFVGTWADKRGIGYKRKYSEIYCWIAYLGLTIVFGIVTIIPFMCVVQFVRHGLAAGGEAIDMSAASEWWPNEAKGFVFSAVHCGYPWGTMIMSVAIAFMLKTGNWQTPFIFIPLIALIPSIIYMLFATRKRFEKNNERIAANGLTPSVTKEEVEISGKTGPAKADTKSKEKGSTLGLLKNKNVLACVICYACIVGAYFGVNYWLTPYISNIGGLDFSKTAIFSSIFTITAGLGQIFWGSSSDKVGCKRTILICCVWLFVCFCFLPMAKTSLVVFVIIQLLMGFCTNACFPVLNNFSSRSVSRNQVSSVLGLCSASMILGGCVPYLMSVFISVGGGWTSETGYMYGLVFISACLVIAFFTALLMSHEVIGKRRGRDWALTSYESCGIEDNR